MPPRESPERRLSRSGKRVSKACKRCRSQKIRCTGSEPCDQCSKRDLNCCFESQPQRVVVTRRYIDNLHARLAALQNRTTRDASPAPVSEQDAGLKPDNTRDEIQLLRQGPRDQFSKQHTVQDVARGKAPLTNPLAFHITDWVPGPKGQPLFMGTSSSWAFARRVFGMTCSRLGESSCSKTLLFDGHVYDTKWDGTRSYTMEDIYDISDLPTPDFAEYLINSVKFHCGQLLYLFDESSFMRKFGSFQLNPKEEARSSPLWFCHYLLLLAFGKSFVVQSPKSTSPAGSDHFIQAMKCMPDFSFFDGDPIEKMQVLCCAALYLQCLNDRTAAYRMIGLALRTALENGMYTEMHSTYLTETYVQQCNLMWWTVYVLERRMSSLLGVPMGIAEESISTPFPSTYNYQQGSNAMEMQVKLCQVLAKIDQTVYGIEGKLDSRYLGATQSVLRSIARVTQQLNGSFDLYGNGSTSGISRISAHLHLLEHHCIILTTRPLLYIFLQSKLSQSDPALMDWLQSETVKSLLHMCVESAQQIVRILSILLDQGLLDSFLPFDMDATFTATISLLMGATIDPSLLHDHSPWTQRAYAIFDNMASRGCISAKLTMTELKYLDSELTQLSSRNSDMVHHSSATHPISETEQRNPGPMDIVPSLETGGYDQSLEIDFAESFGQQYELSPGQLMDLANSLDLDSLNWPFPSMGDFPGHTM